MNDIKITLPTSHHFLDLEKIKRLKELRLYDFLECRPEMLEIDTDLEFQTTFHADNIQPIHEMSDEDFLFLEKIKKTKPNLEIVSFHCATSCKSFKVLDGIAIPDGHIYSREELYRNAECNIREIKKILGDNVSIAIENNNYFPTEAYSSVCEASFLRDIVFSNEVFFLFDNAHARVTSHNMKVNYEKYKLELPMDRLVQIQFCQPTIPKNSHSIARDSHDVPSFETVEEIINLAKEKSVKYITPEYYKNFNILIYFLSFLKNKVSS